MKDPRRQGSVIVAFKGESSKTGTIFVDGANWGAVEWSEKRGVWCIEDVEGGCLRHAASVHGKAAAKEEAIALAEKMVRDGTLPTPEEAAELHREAKQHEREKRAQRPSESEADWENQQATPFYQIFAEAFDLADPGLWKSNSFAMVRPRLVIEVRAAIAQLERDLHKRHMMRRAVAPKVEHELARAREILALLVAEAPR